MTRYSVDNSANPCCRVVWRPGAVPQRDVQGGGHGGAPRLQVQPRRGQVIGCGGSRDRMLTPDWSAGSTWRWCGWAAPSPTCPTSRPSVCRRSAATPRWAASQHWISVHTSQQLASVLQIWHRYTNFSESVPPSVLFLLKVPTTLYPPEFGTLVLIIIVPIKIKD